MRDHFVVGCARILCDLRQEPRLAVRRTVKRPLQLAGFLARLGPFGSAGNDSTSCAYQRRCMRMARIAPDVEEPEAAKQGPRRRKARPDFC
jgi:hypothetical protein